VWAIFLYYAYLGVSIAIGYWRGHFVLLSGQPFPLPKSVAERVVRGALITLEIIAAVELFRLRAAAVPFFMAAWIARAMITTYDVASSVDGRHPIAVLVFGLFSVAIYTALLAYALWLQRNGILRAGA
jgi:hypothetical protein